MIFIKIYLCQVISFFIRRSAGISDGTRVASLRRRSTLTPRLEIRLRRTKHFGAAELPHETPADRLKRFFVWQTDSEPLISLRNIAEALLQIPERIGNLAGYPGETTRVLNFRYEQIVFVKAGAAVLRGCGRFAFKFI